MPQKPKKDCDELYEILKGWNFMEDGKYIIYKRPLWQEAAQATGLSKAHIYQYITQNRGAINKNVETGLSFRLHGPLIPIFRHKTKTIKAKDVNWSIRAPKKEFKGLKDLTESVHLSLKEWDKLGLNRKQYKGRSYEVLEPGWSDLIYYQIFAHLKLPCPFSFKNAKIDKSPGAIYLKIFGHCKECGTDINICSLTEPTENGVELKVSTLDTRGLVHAKKRQLRGNARKKIGEELTHKTPYLWRREQAHNRMEFGDAEPADLFSSVVLRKLRQETRERKLGLKSGDHPLISLYKLANSPEYSACIREVAMHKAYVMYWLPEQLTMYKHFMKNDRVRSISIDATGTISKPLPSTDGSKDTLFMYQAVTGYKGKILPLFQMASAKHDANTLAYWIREWIRSGAKAPQEVVTDYSLALLNGVAMAFNECRLQKYVDQCFSQASGSNPNLKLVTILRLDIAHLIKFITQWSCFSKNKAYVKDFFVRCVALLVIQTDIAGFENLLLAVLIVAFSPKVQEENAKDQCYSSREKLLSSMKTGLKDWNPKYRNPEDDPFGNLTAMNADENNEDEETADDNQRPILNFVKRVERKSKEKLTMTGCDNKYLCKSFGEKLIKLTKQFVLWTHIIPKLHRLQNNVEISAVERASSSRSEGYFKDLKKHILRGEKTLRLDNVIVMHLISLSGSVNLLAPNKHSKHLNASSETSIEDSDDFEAPRPDEDANLNSSNKKSRPGSETPKSARNDSVSSSAESSPRPNTSYSSQDDSSQKVSDTEQGNSAHLKSPENTDDSLNNLTNLSDFPPLSDDKCTIVNSTVIEDSYEGVKVVNSPVLSSHRPMDYTDSTSNNNAAEKIVNDSSCSYASPILPIIKRRRVMIADSESDVPSSNLRDSVSESDMQESYVVDTSDDGFGSVLHDISNVDNAYLNEVDGWRGVLPNNKRKTVYLECCPDIVNLHERPKLTKTLALLINGNHQSLIKTTKGLLKFKNTCAFDSLFHCARVAYVDWTPYQCYVNKSDARIFEMIRIISTRGRISSIYTKRAELLLTMIKSKKNIVDCESNVGFIAEKVFQHEPSLTITQICRICGGSETKRKAVLEVDLNPLYRRGLEGLQESLDNHAKVPQCTTCEVCDQERDVVRSEGAHLIIDIEALKYKTMAQRAGISTEYATKFAVTQIPENLHSGLNSYTLVGAVEYMKLSETVDHYRSLVSRLGVKSKYWQIHDGLTPSAKPYNMKKHELKEKRVIHLLFYIDADPTKTFNVTDEN